jgi:hypothetical protein
MTAEEIKAIDPYNMDTDSLEVFYAPSVGSGSTIYDLSGNNNHGTITNATLSDFWIKQDQFHWNLKKGFSEVYSFDGVNDNITLDTPLAFTGDFFIDFDVFTLSSQFYIASSGGEYLRFTGGYLVFRIDSTVYQILSTSINTRYIGRLQRTDGVITCIVNETEYPVVTSTTNVDISTLGASVSSGYGEGIINSININGEYSLIGIVETGDSTTINGGLQSVKVPYTINGNYTNPAGKWHNDAETEINFPHTATFEVLNRQFTTAPFFTKNAEKYTSDFSSTTDNFAAIVGASGSVAANIDGVTDDSATSFDNCLSYTAASGTNLQHGVLTDMDNILELRTNVDGSNQVFYAEVRFLLPSTNNQINGFRVWTGWGVHNSSNLFNFPQANISITSDAVGAWRKEMFGPFTLTDIGGSTISLRLQGLNGTDFTIDNDAFEDLIYIESVRVIQMPTLKDVTFADMYQTWYDYEYLHRLFAHFVVPNQVHNILAYTDELTADQKQQVYDYLQKNYHPIYTPYSTRVLADGGTLAAGQTNTLTIIDSI